MADDKIALRRTGQDQGMTGLGAKEQVDVVKAQELLVKRHM